MELGLQKDGEFTSARFEQTPPSEYLRRIHEWFLTSGLKKEDVDRVVVVSGPGSFTASRTSTVIANAIAFSRGIPVLGLPNPERLPLSDLMKDFESGSVKGGFISPTYDQPARITLPKKPT